MKRKIICCLCLILLLTACGDANDNNIEIKGFTAIEDQFLYYANDTHIVYYIVSYRNEASYAGFGFMSPYYNNNGKMCKYENHSIVEIK